MKIKPIYLLGLCLIISSCVTVRATIGMPESEFTARYKSAELVKMSAEQDIYRMLLYVNGRQVDKYFYFSDHKLYQVDEGVRRPDVVIQNN